MINPHSLVAYFGIQPTISNRQKYVLEAIIELDICSDREICAYLKKKDPEWDINMITNRRGELKKLNLIKEVDGAFTNKNGYSISKWEANPNYKWQAKERDIKRFNLAPPQLQIDHRKPEVKEMIIKQQSQPILL